MTRRLQDRVVAVTREDDPDEPLRALFAAAGARVRSWPTIATAPTARTERLADALGRLSDFEWIVFTSARAVDAVEPLVFAARRPRALRVAAVGPGTAARLAERGWPADVVGERGAEALAHAIADGGPGGGPDGVRVLFPAGSLARTTLEQALSARGAQVERVEAYVTRRIRPDAAGVEEDLRRGVDAITFASPSAVEALAAATDAWTGPEGCSLVVIGASTRDAAIGLGIPADRIVLADEPAFASLVAAVERALASDAAVAGGGP